MKITNGRKYLTIQIDKELSKTTLGSVFLLLLMAGIALATFLSLKKLAEPREVIYPLIESQPIPEPVPTPEKDVPSLNSGYIHIEGRVSWYGASIEECLGCHPHRREDGSVFFKMANGEILDDSRKTIACSLDEEIDGVIIQGSCRSIPLGSRVKVLNLENMMIASAVVTDTGGFAKYNKIADISKAVRDSIGITGNSVVRITVLK